MFLRCTFISVPKIRSNFNHGTFSSFLAGFTGDYEGSPTFKPSKVLLTKHVKRKITFSQIRTWRKRYSISQPWCDTVCTVTLATYQLTPVWEFQDFHSSVVEDSVPLGYHADSLLHTTAIFRKLGHRSPSDAVTYIRKTESSQFHGLSYILYLRGVSVRHVNTNSGIHYPLVSGDKTAGALGLSLTYIYGRGLECVDL
jgi:hypothetical protein